MTLHSLPLRKMKSPISNTKTLTPLTFVTACCCIANIIILLTDKNCYVITEIESVDSLCRDETDAPIYSVIHFKCCYAVWKHLLAQLSNLKVISSSKGQIVLSNKKKQSIREMVDSLCRDETDAPMA